MPAKGSRKDRRRPEPRPPVPLTPDDYAGHAPAEREPTWRDRDLRPVPSQAEGDRETVEEDLRAQERRGRDEREPRERRARRESGAERGSGR